MLVRKHHIQFAFRSLRSCQQQFKFSNKLYTRKCENSLQGINNGYNFERSFTNNNNKSSMKMINRNISPLFHKKCLYYFSSGKKPQKKQPITPSSNSYIHSQFKKPSTKPIKKRFSLSRSLFKNSQAYVFYDGSKQQSQYMWISGIFLAFFAISLVRLYYLQNGERTDDYIILGIMSASFFFYQKRLTNTIKSISLSPKGDKLYITTYDLLARSQVTLQAPVQAMVAIGKATRFGGNVLIGGGKFGYKPMKFYFSRQYILDRQTFQYVSQGKPVKIAEQFQTI